MEPRIEVTLQPIEDWGRLYLDSEFIRTMFVNSLKIYLDKKLAIARVNLARLILRHQPWEYVKTINAHLSVTVSELSDFFFFFNEMKNGRVSGAFDAQKGVPARKVDADLYKQFLSTIYLNHMRCDLSHLSRSFLMSARVGGQIIGFLWLKEINIHTFEGWEIHLLSVDADYRREHVGTELLNCAIRLVSQLGGKEVFAGVKQGSTAHIMHAFMKRNGFSSVGYMYDIKMFRKEI